MFFNTYHFQDVSFRDEGFYSCVAGNTLGETVSEAFLEISESALHTIDAEFVTFVCQL